MKSFAAFVSFLFVPGVLTAQSVSVLLSALTPLSAQVTNGTNSNATTVPAGPLSAVGAFSATLPTPLIGAGVEWRHSASSIETRVILEHTLVGANNVPGFSAQAGPHQFLLEFAATGNVDTVLSMQRTDQLATGAIPASIQLDFDNDGVIDVTNLQTGSPLEIERSFGPQSLFVRVIVNVTATGNGAFNASFASFSLMPNNSLSITQVINECRPFLPPLPPFVSPTFQGRGVSFIPRATASEPGVIVLGLSAQPALLGNFAGVPCILLPSPDVVWFPPLNPSSLAIPAAVRPVTFYAQGVTLTSAGLVVSDGFVVHAF